MKKYNVVYIWGMNRLVAEIKATDKKEAEYLFLMQYGPGAAIEKIEEASE